MISYEITHRIKVCLQLLAFYDGNRVKLYQSNEALTSCNLVYAVRICIQY